MADVEYHTGGNASWGNIGSVLGTIAFGAPFLSNFARGGCNNGCGGNGWNWGPGFNNGCGCAGNYEGFTLLQQNIQLQAEKSQFKSEKYADQIGKEVYAQVLADMRDEAKKRDTELNLIRANLNALNDYAHNQAIEQARIQENVKCFNEKQELYQQITAGKINETALTLNGKVDTIHASLSGQINTLSADTKGAIENVVTNTNNNFKLLDQSLDCIKASVAVLKGRVDNITKESVPLCAICPPPMPRFNTFATPTAQAPDCGSCCQATTAA